MARRSQAIPGPRRASLTASAKRIDLTDKRSARWLKLQQEWQREAWLYFDEVPEIKFITWYLGNAMAKLRIFPAVNHPTDPEAEPIHIRDTESGVPEEVATVVIDLLTRLRSPIGGQSEILRMLNMNLEVPGECYIVGFAPRTDPLTLEVIDEEWDVKSILEVRAKPGGRWVILESPGQSINSKDTRQLDKEAGDDIFRVWLRHPGWSNVADSLMRGVLGECRSLTSLSQQVLAEANSRANAGILVMSNEMSFGPEGDETIGEDGEEAAEDPFEDKLYEMLAASIEDPSSSASVMPLVMRGPPDQIGQDKFRLVSLARAGDAELDTRIEARVRRIARGLNVPVEVAEGHAQTTFSNAEQIDQDIFDDHLQPRCVLIVDAITQGYLKPRMEAIGIGPEYLDRIFTWYDASKLIRQPDATAASDSGHDRLAISAAAWRAKNGYTEADAPTRDEILESIVFLHARAQLGPEVSLALLKLLGVDIQVEALPGGSGGAGNLQPGGNLGVLLDAIDRLDDRPKALAAGTRPNRPGRQLVVIDMELRTRLVVAAEAALERALEKAGGRLRSKLTASARALVRHVPAYRIAATLGPALVADAGIPEDELFAASWETLGGQFLEWGAAAQEQALMIAARLIGGFTSARREELRARQDEDLLAAWAWMKAAMTTLAHRLLFAPDPLQERQGETSGGRVPAGLVRSAVARAGGARTLTAAALREGEAWVTLGDGGTAPAGGIGSGELISDAIGSTGEISQEGWVWVYGPAFRKDPFEPHEALDGVEFVNFDDEVLANQEGFPEFDFYLPGDHDGCMCDVEPILLAGTEPLPPEEPPPEPEPTGPIPAGMIDPGEKVKAGLGRTADAKAVLGTVRDVQPGLAKLHGVKAGWKGVKVLYEETITYHPTARALIKPGINAASEITMSKKAGQYEFLHEFGHSVDWAPGKGGWASTSAKYASEQTVGNHVPAMLDFLKAATQNSHFEGAVREYSWRINGAEFNKYFTSPREVWARAYSQWAAYTTGNVGALAGLEAEAPLLRWPEAMFKEEIAPRLEAVLRARGLLA